MNDSKLISLLKSLTPAEFRDLEKFVSSPYFSKGRDLTPLLKVLKAFYPEFNDKNLNIEFLFRKLFPRKRFEGKKSYNIIKTLTSQLFILCKDFLILQELKENGKMKQYYLLNQLRKKKMYSEFDREHRNLLAEDKNYEKGNVKDFVSNFFTSSVLMENSLDKDEFSTAFEHNLSKSETIITAALICCFKFEDEKNIARIYNLDMRFTLMNALIENFDPEKLIDEIEKHDGRFAEYLRIYYMIFRMNRHKDETDYYFETKAMLEKSFHLFGQYENHELWNTMLTYCNAKNFSNDDAMFRKELHYIHTKMLEHGIHKRYPDEDFHIVLFRNMLLAAISLREYDWLEDFINKYSSELHNEHREDMRNYSFATLNFLKRNFEKALEHAIKIKFDLFLYKLDVKLLQIRTYYELGYFEEALSLIDTLQHYLRNTDNIPEFHKEGHRNFLNFTKELIKIRISKTIDTGKLEYLKHRILSNKKYGLKWVMEKAEEMKKI